MQHLINIFQRTLKHLTLSKEQMAITDNIVAHLRVFDQVRVGLHQQIGVREVALVEDALVLLREVYLLVGAEPFAERKSF